MGEEISLLSLDDAALFRCLDNLYATWPSDGWVGAADVIASHAKKAYEIEEEFVKRHKVTGNHHLVHPYYKPWCCCRQTRITG